MKNNKAYQSLVGLGLGAIIVLGAGFWALQSASDPNVVGANIGAGVIGVVGLGLIAVSIVGVFVAFTKNPQEEKK